LNDDRIRTDDRIRALIVAVGDYERLPELATVETDAAALAEVLGQPTVGAYQVKMLDSPRVSVALAEITEQLRASRLDDTLLIYFAGYGVRADNELFLCAHDTDLRDLRRTAIPVTHLRSAIDTSELRHVMVIVDSCSASVQAETAPLDALRGQTYTLLASTNSRPVVVADSPGKTRMASAFTRALIDGLWRGEADYDNSGVVSLDELREFVRRRMLAVPGRSDAVVYMAAGPHNLRLAHSGRLTLLVREELPRDADVDAAFQEITSGIDFQMPEVRRESSAWHAFLEGFLSIFGLRWGRHEGPRTRPSAWEKLSGRLTEKYEEMGPPPNPHSDGPGRSQQ
jgi:hypothetical protein